jgi:ribosomal protein L11
LEAIAEIKKTDMNTEKLESVIRSIAGTAKNMGVEIEAGAVRLD